MQSYAETPSSIAPSLESALHGLIAPREIKRREDQALVIHGQLLVSPDQVYRPLRERFEALGYTPFLRSHTLGVELIAVQGVIKRQPRRWLLNLALFLATVLTVLLTGARDEVARILTAQGAPDAQIEAAIGTLALLRDPASLLLGVPFAVTLLGILGSHEMGHYVVSRLRGAPASLPYFIPMPPAISFTGTFGAVIVQREPFEDRRTLLEVAIAGPIAGLVVAIPVLIYGLATSTVATATPPYLQEGNSVLYAALKLAVFGQVLPSGGRDVQINAIALAGWIGLLVTMLNLLPVGQLDGGHIAYALFGEGAKQLAYVMMGVCAVLGVLVSFNWLVWLVLISLMGPRHPAPFNDVLKLGPRHIALGAVGLLLFLLLFMPNPIQIVG